MLIYEIILLDNPGAFYFRSFSIRRGFHTCFAGILGLARLFFWGYPIRTFSRLATLCVLSEWLFGARIHLVIAPFDIHDLFDDTFGILKKLLNITKVIVIQILKIQLVNQ